MACRIRMEVIASIGFVLVAHMFMISRSTVTVVNSACTPGKWIPNVTTVQNFCLTCYCVQGTLSICRTNFFRSECGTNLAVAGVSITVPTLPPPTPTTTTTTARPPNATVPVTLPTPTPSIAPTPTPSIAPTPTTTRPPNATVPTLPTPTPSIAPNPTTTLATVATLPGQSAGTPPAGSVVPPIPTLPAGK